VPFDYLKALPRELLFFFEMNIRVAHRPRANHTGTALSRELLIQNLYCISFNLNVLEIVLESKTRAAGRALLRRRLDDTDLITRTSAITINAVVSATTVEVHSVFRGEDCFEISVVVFQTHFV
jgi:hypothetical protein